MSIPLATADGVLKLYPRGGRGGSKSSVMYVMIADDASIGDVIEHLVESTIRPRQLLVEFHHRFAGRGGVEKTTAATAALRGVGYRLFAVPVTGRELFFLHDRDGLT